jgi:hypothetical protein
VMQSASIRLDDSEFQQAMADYIRVSSKDAADSMNRTMNSLAVLGFEHARLAQESEIRNVQTLEWWPKYVASAMVRRKAQSLATKMRKADAKGKTLSAKAFANLSGLHYSRAGEKEGNSEAQKESARIIKGRSVAIGFVRFFFATMSRSMRGYVPGAKVPPSKSFKGFDVAIVPATLQRPSISAEVAYPYRKLGQRTVKRAEALLQEAMDAARPALIADMRDYIARKMREAAEGVSA